MFAVYTRFQSNELISRVAYVVFMALARASVGNRRFSCSRESVDGLEPCAVTIDHIRLCPRNDKHARDACCLHDDSGMVSCDVECAFHASLHTLHCHKMHTIRCLLRIEYVSLIVHA